MFNKKLEARVAEIEEVLTRTDNPEDYVGSEIDAKVEESDFEEYKKEINQNLKRGTEIMTRHSEKLAELKQYVECSVCGCLVSKEKAKVEWEMRDKHKFNTATEAWVYIMDGRRELEKEAVKTYTCIHCQKGKRK